MSFSIVDMAAVDTNVVGTDIVFIVGAVEVTPTAIVIVVEIVETSEAVGAVEAWTV